MAVMNHISNRMNFLCCTNHSRGQEGLYNTMEIMDILDVIDTEKCRKMGSIRVESASIRVKVLRKYNFGASK